jgi:hypothetical protein
VTTKENNNGTYNVSGVQKCAGQAGRTSRQNSKFAQHKLDTRHEYETMEKTIEILHIEKKGQMRDTYERFHIYEISKENIQLNDNFAETYNMIHDIIITAYQNVGNGKQQPD